MPNESQSSAPPQKQEVGGILGWIEKMGNRIPDITMLFICAFVITCIASAILSQMHFDYVHPSTGAPIEITNMLSPASLVTLLTKMVTNYTGFPPLGMVIVATLGIGIADGSGYINTGLKKILSVTPKKLITPIVILVGMISHLAPDSGYMIIIPIAAYMFYATGKHPLAGIGASFAGIAGAFAANYTPSAIDPVIQGFTQMAAQIIDPTYEVNVLCNYFYAFGSTFIVIAGCWWVTERVVEPWCRKACPVDDDIDVPAQDFSITPQENRAFYIASGVLVALLVGLVLALLPEDSLLRDPATGNIASFKAPVMQSIVAIIFLLAAATGVVYGIISGKFRSSKDFTKSMEEITKTLIQLIVFYFFAAQFMYAFGTSNIGALIAIAGAEFLKSLALPPQVTIFGIIIFVGMLNLIITSASAKWAILAPIFVPMLMAVGIAPELTQAAFRVSDSAVNVCTPMFAFYPLIIVYCQKYYKNTGVGTLSSLMLPYTITLLITLTIMLYVFWWFNIPLGFQADYVYPRVMF
ncbi:efflux pump component MtrF [Centipeda periodontii DSM 2778]|uniref:Efflux pump component MtrF n=1 Tax=Centipeda periodontii DSM 2778 TaxID=888060 RepID=F5RPS7_9FIRM|nr:AbgT family transporter [Centipeda periodontii]EGK57578.1 efflux pump component MtrF [Centipeda periodontii DSM 2778]